ncbi:hypothetical protein Pcinc_025692 [Petrolisthes cinctipes]|uniref:Uncharacterized protein n=1 Tax=Petrolisthes cinctipes TaxID=88211 RepID=A0AAE1F7D6_PETCI|nr:hypothetical protein Pcinc_025692 [Petrolisthes cinctipes]
MYQGLHVLCLGVRVGFGDVAGSYDIIDKRTAICKEACHRRVPVDTPYAKLSEDLIPLLGRIDQQTSADSTGLEMALENRLSIMNGSVPYLPCRIRTIDQSDIRQCVASRSRQGITTWLAFIGDSTMRQKVHTLLLFLPQNLQYSYFLGTRQVNVSEFKRVVTFHNLRPPTFDIIGKAVTVPPQDDGKQEPSSSTNRTTTTTNLNQSSSPDDDQNSNPYIEIHDEYPTYSENSDPKFNVPLWEDEVQPSQVLLRVTLVWSSGTWARKEKVKMEINKLEEWLEGPSLPHVVVVGLSTWNILARDQLDELSPATHAEIFARHFIHSITRLADRTTVLYWRQSRARWFNYEGDKANNEMRTSQKKLFWELLMTVEKFNDSISLVDSWMWNKMRRTAMWHWDSTLPFNLANIRECHRLMKANLFNHPLYTGRWWNCFDVHHSSYETNYVELQMLFNLLCNDYMEPSDDGGPYCC